LAPSNTRRRIPLHGGILSTLRGVPRPRHKNGNGRAPARLAGLELIARTGAERDDPSAWLLMARAGAALFAAGATVSLLALAFFRSPDANLIALLGLAGVSYGLALALWRHAPAISPRIAPAFGIAATLVVTSVIYFWGGDVAGVNVLYYLWVTLFAFYFYSRGQATMQLGVIAVAYGAALVLRPPSSSAVQAWLVTVGSLAVAGVLVGTLKDSVQRLFERLSETVRRDDLTGLLNRRGFAEKLELEIERARRSQRPASVLIADPDALKDINDRFGQRAGDRTLSRLGALLAERKRKVDVVGRLDGGEFGLILPATDERGAFRVAERIRSGVARSFEEESLALKVSFGIATFPTHGLTVEALMRAVDQALYAAKALGGDRCVIHSAELGNTVHSIGRRSGRHSAHLSTVLALAETLDHRDKSTYRHSKTVGRYAERIAQEFGLPEERVGRIRLAGILHDVGKIGVPDAVLQKPGPLDPEEEQVVRKHPEIGARILEGADLDDVREWVLAHQERTDGHGYPRGLGGEEIPLEARILAVCDAYEAMTNDRVYRSAMSHEAAQEELLEHAGSQFDVRVVAAFMRVLKRDGLRAPRKPEAAVADPGSNRASRLSPRRDALAVAAERR
jgi:diguanylate cyclase (GGDEF)-like protein/putative nucleotidyltransferase with HDIG domain